MQNSNFCGFFFFFFTILEFVFLNHSGQKHEDGTTEAMLVWAPTNDLSDAKGKIVQLLDLLHPHLYAHVMKHKM